MKLGLTLAAAMFFCVPTISEASCPRSVSYSSCHSGWNNGCNVWHRGCNVQWHNGCRTGVVYYSSPRIVRQRVISSRPVQAKPICQNGQCLPHGSVKVEKQVKKVEVFREQAPAPIREVAPAPTKDAAPAAPTN